MNCNEAVRWIMDKQNYTTTTLRIKLKIPSDKSNVLAGRIHQENMSIAILSELVKAMGYMIVAMPDNVKVPNDAVILDYTETEAAAKRKAKTRERNKVQPAQSDTSESSKSDSSKPTPASTPNTADKADEGEPAKEQAPATDAFDINILKSIEDEYLAAYMWKFHKIPEEFEYYDKTAPKALNDLFLWAGDSVEEQKKTLNDFFNMVPEDKVDASFKDMENSARQIKDSYLSQMKRAIEKQSGTGGKKVETARDFMQRKKIERQFADDDDTSTLPEPIDLTPYLISEDDDELPFGPSL